MMPYKFWLLYFPAISRTRFFRSIASNFQVLAFLQKYLFNFNDVEDV